MLYLEDYLEMIEHLPQELRDRFTEMREMDLSVQNVMDSLEKRVRMFFSQCRRNELQPNQADNEFTGLRRDYYKVLEDADEKVQLSSQMYDLVERYLRRLDSELHKFKCELEADHNGITEILEKRSLELDGNSSSSLMNNIMGNTSSSVTGASGTTNNSQKENRYFVSISNSNSHSSSLRGSDRDRDRETSSTSHRYNRHKAEKRRDSHNGPTSQLSSGQPPEKRQMMSSGSGLVHNSSNNNSSSLSHSHHHSSSSAAAAAASSNVIHSSASGNNNLNHHVINSPMVRGSASSSTVSNTLNVNLNNSHYNAGTTTTAITGNLVNSSLGHSNSSSSSSSSTVSNLNSLPANVAAAVNPVIVTTTLGTGANAVNLGSTSYTAEVMRAASQAIAMTHQMQQGRRTASLKASVEAATSGGSANPGKGDLLGRELVGATHNAIQAAERESFNSSNQRRHKKKVTSSVGAAGVSSAAGSSAVQMSGMDTISVPSSRVDDNGMIVESTPDGEWTYDPNEPRYCICNQVSYGDMVACDNDVCPFEWFHYPCVGITQSPKGKWYCPQCTSSMKRRGSRKT